LRGWILTLAVLKSGKRTRGSVVST
jgi:hypothetical protein